MPLGKYIIMVNMGDYPIKHIRNIGVNRNNLYLFFFGILAFKIFLLPAYHVQV